MESQSVSAASKTFTVPQWFVSDKLLTSGVSNSQDTTKQQQRANNTQQSLTQLCIPNTNHLNIRAHIYVAKATWYRICIVHNKFFGNIYPHSVWGYSKPEHSSFHLPTFHRYTSSYNISLNFYLKCRHAYDKMSSATPQC